MRLTPIIATLALVALAPIPANAQDSSSAGTRMAAEAERAGDNADDKAALAGQWKDGEKMVAEGNRLVSRSERRMARFTREASEHHARAERAAAEGLKAEASLAEGRRLVAAGSLLKAQAEARFPLVPSA